MLFGVVFIEKNAKNKTKCSTFENLLPHIPIKCPELQLKNCNEIPQATIEKSHWNTPGQNWKITMKCPGLQLKFHNEMPRAAIEKLQ